MSYCQKCHHLTDSDSCSNCGNNKLSAVKETDLCFLIEKQMIWVEMLKERLNSAHIPYECIGNMGAAMAIKVGPYLENYQFYVPYADYQQAKRIIDEMFLEE